MNHFGYIDAANLDRGSRSLGYIIDYMKLYGWLRQKYNLHKIYMFMGFIPRYTSLYSYLRECGYILIFKETITNSSGEVKGNCDAELVLQAVVDFHSNSVDLYVFITGDGDFRCLIDFLLQENKKVNILAPDKKKCSILLKRTKAKITYLEDHYHKFLK